MALPGPAVQPTSPSPGSAAESGPGQAVLALVSRHPAGSRTRTWGSAFRECKVKELETGRCFLQPEPVAPIWFGDVGPLLRGGDASLGFGLGGGGLLGWSLAAGAFLCRPALDLDAPVRLALRYEDPENRGPESHPGAWSAVATVVSWWKRGKA